MNWRVLDMLVTKISRKWLAVWFAVVFPDTAIKKLDKPRRLFRQILCPESVAQQRMTGHADRPLAQLQRDALHHPCCG